MFQRPDIAQELAQAVLQLTEQAVTATPNAAEATCVAAAAGISAASVVATILGNGYGKGNDEKSGVELAIENAVNKQTLLFGACVIAASTKLATCPAHPENEHAVSIDFGPHSLLRAMEIYESITGEKPDPYLQPQMVRQTREYEKDTPPAKRVNPLSLDDGHHPVHHGLLH